MTASLKPVESSSAAKKPAPLPLTFFDDMEATPSSKEWLLKNGSGKGIAKGEVSGWIGPPGVGKSIILGDLANHASAGLDWRGFKSKGQFGVLYIALERGKLVERRIKAQANRDGLKGLPVAVSGVVLDMMKEDCVGKIKATMDAQELRYGRKVELVIIDTVAKAVAAGGGKENEASDMGKFLSNVRRVVDETGAHVALIGHTGKNVENGARGSNAWLGDVDLELTITGEKVRNVKITKANDQELGPFTTYQVESYYLGDDGDGDRVTIGLAARHDEADNVTAAPSAKINAPSRPHLSTQQQIGLDIIRDAIAEAGGPPPPSTYVPIGIRAVEWKTVRIFFKTRSLSDGKDPDRIFRNVKDELRRKGYIGIHNDWIWLADG